MEVKQVKVLPHRSRSLLTVGVMRQISRCEDVSQGVHGHGVTLQCQQASVSATHKQGEPRGSKHSPVSVSPASLSFSESSPGTTQANLKTLEAFNLHKPKMSFRPSSADYRVAHCLAPEFNIRFAKNTNSYHMIGRALPRCIWDSWRGMRRECRALDVLRDWLEVINVVEKSKRRVR